MSDALLADPGHLQRIARAVSVPERAARETLALLAEGNTVPFITRYRKERTGGLDEVQIRALQEEADRVRALEARRDTVLRTILAQGKLSDDLRDQVMAAGGLQELEDLYLPYKPKRRTRAEKARERGLEPLADLLRGQEVSDAELRRAAEAYVSAEREVASVDDALEGAADIVAEGIAEDADTRGALRALYDDAMLASEKARLAKPEDRTYETYEGFRARIGAVRHHQVLALDRGERAGQLSVAIELDADDIDRALRSRHERPGGAVCPQAFDQALKGAWRRLLQPALEREVRAGLTERAMVQAIAEFARNLKPLLLTRPVAGARVLAIDPGLRTGCKLAALDAHGRFLESATIFPHPPRSDQGGAGRILAALVKRHAITAIAIGNGTASRETEAFVVDALKAHGLDIPYTLVDESGASVYSASEVAAEEYPDLDATVRGTISIGRRLQDPLAELVKIDPRSIGVGMYQHDVDPRELLRALDAVVEDCVNYVGVDLNTASSPLLARVAGLSSSLAKAIVERREASGPFRSRRELLDVKGIGPRTFEQAAGFLRIPGAAEPLDATAVHPESYDAARRLLERVGATLDKGGARLPEHLPLPKLAAELEVGLPTLEDIAGELRKPGRDPREDLPPVIFRRDLLSLDDLEEGAWIPGTVRNVVPFGAFVDLGLKVDGLVHISELADRYVEDPHTVIRVGDRIEARVLKVDKERGRISLSMRREERPARGGADQGRPRERSGPPSSGRASAKKDRGDAAAFKRGPAGGGYQPFAGLKDLMGGGGGAKKRKGR